MIFLYLGLFFGYIWWLANTHLKDQFNLYLKYSSLFFISVLIATDAYLFVETEHFYRAKEIGGDSGIAYSFFDTATNTTVEHTVYAKQDEDSGTIVAYHWAEFEVMPLFVMMLPYIAIFIATTFALQYVYMWWRATYYGSSSKNDKNSETY